MLQPTAKHDMVKMHSNMHRRIYLFINSLGYEMAASSPLLVVDFIRQPQARIVGRIGLVNSGSPFV